MKGPHIETEDAVDHCGCNSAEAITDKLKVIVPTSVYYAYNHQWIILCGDPDLMQLWFKLFNGFDERVDLIETAASAIECGSALDKNRYFQ